MQKILLKKWLIITISLLCALTLVNCNLEKSIDDPTPNENPRGKILDSVLKVQYGLETLRLALNAGGIDIGIELKFGVEAYRIIYQTVDTNGNITQASGALFLPKEAGNCPLLSLQHGTVVLQNRVASETPLLSPESFILASEGSAVCVPDYLGLGESPGIHPYLHAQSSADAVIDFIRACKTFCSRQNLTLNSQLFLAGYSEGGYVTLVTQKELEENYSSEFNITAVAPMAGPYDLKNTALHILRQNNYSTPGYIAYLIVAYNHIYNWNRLDNIFDPLFAGSIESLFTGDYSMGEINARLPENMNELLTQSFIIGMLNGSDTQVISALEENSLLDWTPKAPIRFYHGDSDKTVPYFNAETAAQSLRENGGNDVEVVTIYGGDHGTSLLPCIALAHEWFRSL